jgi:Phosphopantetheine attachment site
MNIQTDLGGTAHRATIATIFEEVAREHNRPLAPLTDDLPLMTSGLDSLSFAIIVARLEETFGTDPFSSPDGQTLFPVTFGDLVRLYGRGDG